MSYEVEVKSVFTESTNRDYAQRVVDHIAERFKDASINTTNVPDVRFYIPEGGILQN